VTDPEARDPYAPPPEDGSAPAGGQQQPAGPQPPPPPYGAPPASASPPPYGAPAAYGAPPPGVRPSDGTPGPVDRGGRKALWLALAGVLTTVFVPPVALCLGIAAIVVGARASSRASKARGTAPGAVPAIVVGCFVAAAGLLLSVMVALFFDELRDFQDCMAGAGTRTAERICREELEDAILGG
jgi:hypothetical protein